MLKFKADLITKEVRFLFLALTVWWHNSYSFKYDHVWYIFQNKENCPYEEEWTLWLPEKAQYFCMVNFQF